MSWRPFAAVAESSTATKSPRPSPRSTTCSSRPVDPRAGEHIGGDVEHVHHAERIERVQVAQLAAHRHLLGRGDVVARHVERDHMLVQAHAPDARAAALLDAPQLDVGDRLGVGDAERVVECRAQALRIGAHACGARRVRHAAARAATTGRRRRSVRGARRGCPRAPATTRPTRACRARRARAARVPAAGSRDADRRRRRAEGRPAGPSRPATPRGPCRIVSLDTPSTASQLVVSPATPL